MIGIQIFLNSLSLRFQNPAILQNLIHTSQSPTVRQLASEKLTFEPLTANEKEWLEFLVDHPTNDMEDKFLKTAQQKLKAGGTYSVKDPDFLTGANISVCLTKEFMEAVETDQTYELRFPAIEDYDASEMADYDQHWMEIGDVREWAETGRKVNYIKRSRLANCGI